MYLNGAYAEAEFVCNYLVGATGHQPVKNVPLACAEACYPPDRIGDIAIARDLVFVIECRLDRPKQRMIGVWLFQEKSLAPAFIARTVAWTSPWRGTENDRQIAPHPGQLRLDFQPVSPAWQTDVQ